MSVPPSDVYLQPDFDGSSLKVAQLRGILLQHDISLPPSAKKADLVAAFESQVQARASELNQSAKPSSKGIVRVKDGKQVEGTTESEASSDEQPKRARGRPKKSTGVSVEIPVPRRTRRTESMTPARTSPPDSPAVEAEEEEEPAIHISVEQTPRAKVKSDTEESKKPKTPRRSEDSGFSDYNPFQSGGEEGSDREKRRRKSSAGVSAKKPTQPRYSEPAPRSDTPSLKRVGPSKDSLKTPPRDQTDSVGKTPSKTPSKIAKPSIATRPAPPAGAPPVDNRPPLIAIPLTMLFLILMSSITGWQKASQEIGFCDTGSSTNNLLLARTAAIEAANSCIARRTAQALDDPSAPRVECDVSALPLLPFIPRPSTCAPCPQHAACANGRFYGCKHEYVYSENPLGEVFSALNGMPFFGPRAFPPTCRPDTVRKRLIGTLAKEMEKDLARGRGAIVCAGYGAEDGRRGPGERFGLEESKLKARYFNRRDPKFTPEQFSEIYDAALADLVEHDDVIESIDADGRSWYTSARPEFNLSCKIKLAVFSLFRKWRSQLIGSGIVLVIISYLRSTLRHRRAEKYQAEELVQVVLKRLQDQESLHYTDPVTTPNPFIPPTQLRDLVLPPKGSSNSRTRLWQRVQDLVEANANVSVREQEVKGEIWKTWEWAGVGEQRRVSFE
ncbi:Man1-Src1p-C-terminal domain-domain-containing protein [Kockovaella imperatae]|uniref:Man1-Src1p-C-terminal domain-domain-containing protein n=1 Tax=Kockovaella imperatae TaxID=4999 RepID=A0A1Y1U7L8_9TREE|nr:Man1-Src1p-C-terminal domain-domain-containing protein [Kockovaella imperatae]ORX33516.1 Man1-Src1p-C-terminal domain-domain-containing protein [Kockovaella imperatae]